MKTSRSDRARALFDVYTRDLSREDLQRLFTHDTRDAYRFFARGLDEDQFAALPLVEAAAAARPPDLRRLHAEAAAGAAGAVRRRAVRRAARASSSCFADSPPIEMPFGLPFIQVAVLAPSLGRRHLRAAPQPASSSICWCCWKSPTGCRSRGSSRSRARSSWRCCRAGTYRAATSRSAASRGRPTPSAGISTTCCRS